MSEDNPLAAGDLARAQALEKIGRDRYEMRVPKSAPDWDDAPPLLRYTIMEQVNDVINEVLSYFTPMSPDHGALALRFELLAGELDAMEDGQTALPPSHVAQLIRRTIAEGSEYGIPKGETDGTHDG